MGDKHLLNKIIALKQRLLSHQGFMKYASNLSWLMMEKILRMVVGVFVGIWLARYLGPEQYGILSYIQSIVVFLVAFCGLGLDSIVVRELVQNAHLKATILGTAFLLKFSVAIIAIPLLYVLLIYCNMDDDIAVLVLIASLSVLFHSVNVIDFFYQSIVMSKYVAWVNSFTLLMSSIIKIALILQGASLSAFVWMGVFDAVVLAIGLVYFYGFKNYILTWKFDKNIACLLIQKSIPVLIAGVMFITYSKVDQLMIASFYDMTQVGYFSASLRLVEMFYVIPALLVNSFFPAILQAKEQSKELYALRMRRLVLLCLMPCLLICVVISFGASFWVHLLYGQNFAISASVLQLQIWLLMLTSVGYLNGIWFVSEKLEWQLAINYSLAMISNVVLNYVMIPYYGVLGAVYASLISQIIVYYGLLWFNEKSRYLVKNIYTLSLFRRL